MDVGYQLCQKSVIKMLVNSCVEMSDKWMLVISCVHSSDKGVDYQLCPSE